LAAEVEEEEEEEEEAMPALRGRLRQLKRRKERS